MSEATGSAPAAAGSVRRSRDVPMLVERAREGDPRAVARLITLVESGDETLPRIAAALAPHTGRAQVVGLTGSPGVGKSTTTNELVRALRARGHRVGVLAIDPSSPFTGGAILGDRVRMQDHATDPGVYIRSMSSRGHLGGLSAATPQAVRVLEGAGCDVVLVETVGVGQAEVEVASLADTTLVLLAPGMGDAIQAVKAGILEIADIFVVNKADRDGADATVRDIQGMIALGERGPGQWRPQVVRAVAVRGEGIDDVAAAVDKHRDWLVAHDELRRRREARAAAEIEAIALGALRARIGSLRDGTQLPALAAEVAAGAVDPYAAADTLLAQLSG
ncbi:methylmalonyl Co-A mutase-associated GTPase MeaB [Micromonospora sp. NPDC047793]|uniref:methylmalonyl Co-A mutase-associated GTPase MeaB n=1 Tax=unclassified Micromonospora TaxID=2617518 RepID=UPI001034215C|nr:methylmalonyl Co-A mutase-associated GTPase MeaB [Verrucosispora sp. SN26_14.1]TBL27952.1 methylmalonyl Co-A mutase-associated GTPase MeaB [Verrucosispora sp. SN26_14.1]